MLRLKFLAALVALTAVAGSAHAMFDACCGGNFFVGAEWLYMRPYANHQTYGRTMDIHAPPPAPSADSVRNKLHDVCPDFNSGVRVFAGWTDCCDCWGMWLSYLYFDSSASANLAQSQAGLVAGTDERFVVNPQGMYADDAGAPSPREYVFGRANGTSTFKYQNLAFELSGKLQACCPVRIDFLAGVGWAQVNHRLDARFGDPVAPAAVPLLLTTSNRSYFDGVGPRIGIRGAWTMPCWSQIKLVGTANTTLLIAETRGDFSQVILNGEQNVPFDLNYRETFADCTRLIPALEAKIGLMGAWQCGCVGLMFEIGYRAETYINALYTHRFTGSTIAPNNPGGTEERMETSKGWTSLGDISFGGLYLGGGVMF